MRLKIAIFVIVLTTTLAACASGESVPTPDGGIFRPATQAVTIQPTLLSDLVGGVDSVTREPDPTPTPSCTNNLYFLSDLTIPDGTVVEPGETLDKRWEVQNNGTCNWDHRYQVKLIAGPGMGVPVQQALVPALSGTNTMVRMVYIAPDEHGNYRSAWQAFDPEMMPFGDLFFIDIVVGIPEEEDSESAGD